MRISTETILKAYKKGIFPMAEGAKSQKIVWIKPERRGILPIGKLHISRSMKKFIRKEEIQTSINTCFTDVLTNCKNRNDTWINSQLSEVYLDLNIKGHALSIEIWRDKKLIGGLLGVVVGACFFGESMFSLFNNGSKLALIVTMARLVNGKFLLFDTQFLSHHLSTMGGCEIPDSQYMAILTKGLATKSNFFNFPTNYSWSEMIQLSSQNLYR